MSSMNFSRSVISTKENFIRATVDPFSHLPRAGKRVHQFSLKSLLLVIFDGKFGKDHVTFIVQERVRETGVNVFMMIDVVMVNLFAGNTVSA